MASQLSVASNPSPARYARPHWTIEFCVRRRVPISIVLFTSLILIDLLLIRSQPRDPLNLTDPFVSLAELLIVAGLVIRSWAAGSLRKQRELATTGPYAWIRNPLYFGSFLMMVGFGTLVHDLITLWFVGGPIAWIYWQTIKSEERYLAHHFPYEWPRYAATVPRFMPRSLIPPRANGWSLVQWVRNSEYQAWLGSLAAVIGIKLWQIFG